MKKRAKREGLTAFDDSPVVNRPSTNDAIPVVNWPGISQRRRVVVDRPAPAPVRRTCPTCGAVFDDYTQRHNTVYCRASCKTMMHRIKRQTAIAALATVTGVPLERVEDLYESHGLKELERLLKLHGWHFVQEERNWRSS